MVSDDSSRRLDDLQEDEATLSSGIGLRLSVETPRGTFMTIVESASNDYVVLITSAPSCDLEIGETVMISARGAAPGEAAIGRITWLKSAASTDVRLVVTLDAVPDTLRSSFERFHRP